MPFGWKYRGVHTGLHFRLAHSFVGLGFCASVALRTASRPINVPFSSLSRFLSFYEFSQVLLGAPSSFLLSWTYRIDTMSAMCTEYIIPLFILSRMDPAREVPAPPSARGVRAGPVHGRFNRPGARSTRAAPGQGKAGCNGRDVMRFHRVIISSEGCIVSCLKPVARRVRQSRPSSRRDAFGRDELRPSPGLSRQTLKKHQTSGHPLSRCFDEPRFT